ncbi:MAG: GtrA family protein [Methylobacteriaceae bacterium]|nr:GtrA family protein [Methylobacteriaceae bacterium]
MTEPSTATPHARALPAFLLAGALGFLVDAGGAAALVAAGWSAPAARLPSILAALTLTWALNRRLAFAPAPGGALAEFGRYLLVSAGGAGLNLMVYLMVFAAAPARGPLVAAIAVAAGSVAALAFNYLGYRRFAFAGPLRPPAG